MNRRVAAFPFPWLTDCSPPVLFAARAPVRPGVRARRGACCCRCWWCNTSQMFTLSNAGTRHLNGEYCEGYCWQYPDSPTCYVTMGPDRYERLATDAHGDGPFDCMLYESGEWLLCYSCCHGRYIWGTTREVQYGIQTTRVCGSGFSFVIMNHPTSTTGPDRMRFAHRLRAGR